MDFEILWRKIHATLTKSEEETLDHWLNENPKHRKLFDDARNYYKHGSDFGKRPVDLDSAWGNVLQKLPQKQKRRRRITPVLIIAAACVSLLLMVYYFWKPFDQTPQLASGPEISIEPGTDKAILILEDGSTHDLSAGQDLKLEVGDVNISSQGTSIEYTQGNGEKKIGPRKQNRKEIRYNTLKIPRGGEFYLVLSDNTKVWLNSETTLRYPVEFIGDERRVELTGEAFFEVEKDEDRPFSVVSDDHVVEVRGTSFNISSYPDDSMILTTLVEGKVEVFLGEYPGTRQTLLPSHQSFFSKGEDNILQKEVDIMEFIAWKDGEFYFKDQSLEDIMKTLSRWYDIEVIFNEPQAKDILFTGHLQRYENFERILNLIERTDEVSYTADGKIITIDIINN